MVAHGSPSWDITGPEGVSRRPIVDTLIERFNQFKRFGEQNHDLPTWLCILTEEVGELAEAILKSHPELNPDQHGTHSSSIYEEVIQVAAVAVAIAEFLDRTPPETPADKED